MAGGRRRKHRKSTKHRRRKHRKSTRKGMKKKNRSSCLHEFRRKTS
jgi:uncharacterized protein with WD repeat